MTTNTVISYIDHDTLKKEGRMRKIWSMEDLKKRDEDGELSATYRLEFDCKEERVRFLTVVTFAEHMAQGKILNTVTPEAPKWTDIAPGSIFSATIRVACSN